MTLNLRVKKILRDAVDRHALVIEAAGFETRPEMHRTRNSAGEVKDEVVDRSISTAVTIKIPDDAAFVSGLRIDGEISVELKLK